MQEVPMAVSTVPRRSSQRPLFARPQGNPHWTNLSSDVQQKIVRLLAQLLRQHRARQVKELGIQEVLGAPRAPRQRAYIERVIGTIRREFLDHMIVFNEASLCRQRKFFVEYHHVSRTHLSLEKGTSESRPRSRRRWGEW
jgi:transposase InsO family protein